MNSICSRTASAPARASESSSPTAVAPISTAGCRTDVIGTTAALAKSMSS